MLLPYAQFSVPHYTPRWQTLKIQQSSSPDQVLSHQIQGCTILEQKAPSMHLLNQLERKEGGGGCWRDGSGLRALAALAEDAGLIPSMLTTTCNSGFRGSSALFWTLRVLHTHDAQPHVSIHIHIKIMNTFKERKTGLGIWRRGLSACHTSVKS